MFTLSGHNKKSEILVCTRDRQMSAYCSFFSFFGHFFGTYISVSRCQQSRADTHAHTLASKHTHILIDISCNLTDPPSLSDSSNCRKHLLLTTALQFLCFFNLIPFRTMPNTLPSKKKKKNVTLRSLSLIFPVCRPFSLMNLPVLVSAFSGFSNGLKDRGIYFDAGRVTLK